jgi:hypothetical protein
MATGYSVTFTVIDEATAPIERINRRIREMREPIERMSRSVQKFIDPVGLEKKADEFRTITRTVGEASSALSRLVPLMGTLTGAASVAGMAELAKSAAAFGDSLLRVSTRTRLTTNQLQDLQYGYQRFGGNTDDMTEAVGALSDKLGEAQTGNQQAATGFAALGVKIVDSQGHLRTTNDVIDETIDKLGALKDPFDRIRIASMLGSKNLALVSERLQRLHKNMQDLRAEGAIVPHLTPQQIEDTDKYNVAVGKVTSSVSALGTQLGATLDKNLTPFMDKWDTFTRDSTPSIVGAFDKITAAILHQIDASITENEKLVEAAKKGDWWEFLFGEAGKPLAVPAAPATTGPAIPGRFSSGRLPPPGPVVPGRGVPTPPGFLPLEMRPTPPGPIAPPVAGPPHFGAVPGRGPPPGVVPGSEEDQPGYRFPRYQGGGIVTIAAHTGEMVLPEPISTGLQAMIRAARGTADGGRGSRAADSLVDWLQGVGAPVPRVEIDNVEDFLRQAGGGGGGGGGAAGGVPRTTRAPANPFAPVPDISGMTEHERNFLALAEKYESRGRNVMNYIGDARHTAQGYWQLTNQNWTRLAPQLGITAPDAMHATRREQAMVALALDRESGEQNWLKYNANLRAAVARGEQMPAGVLARIPQAEGAPGELATGAAPARGSVDVTVTHRNPPRGATIAATGTGDVSVAPPRVEYSQLSVI